MGSWSPNAAGATTGDDVFSGNASNETADGLGGNDALFGNGGRDSLSGSAGNDTLNGGGSNDTLNGGSDNDTIFDQSGVTTSIDGGDGNDRIDLSFSTFASGTVAGGTGVNVLYASSADISHLTLTGLQTLETGPGGVSGTAAQFDAFDHIVYSVAPGNGTIAASLSLTTGGTLDLSDELGGQYAHVSASDLASNITTGTGNDRIDGGIGNDTLNGGTGTGQDTLNGGEGNDTLSGSAGDDIINGGGGNDSLSGGEDEDTITDQSGTATSIDGGNSDDRIDVSFSAFGSGTVAGGAGADVLYGYASDISHLTLGGIETLATNDIAVTATAAQLEAFDHIVFSTDPGFELFQAALQLSGSGTVDLSDELGTQWVSADASDLGNAITAGSGDDRLVGGNGSDTLNGGDGNDALVGGGGDDSLSGGDNNDTISDNLGTATSMDGGTGNDLIDVSLSNFSSGTVEGGSGADVLSADAADISHLTLSGLQTLATGSDGVTGTAAQFDAFDHIVRFVQPGSETSPASLTLTTGGTLDLSDELGNLQGHQFDQYADVSASDLDSNITTAAGNDQIEGGSGNDTLSGGAGADTLIGGDGGNNTLDGGAGDDILNGGSATDTARFANAFATYTITTVTAGFQYSVVGEGTDDLVNVETGLFSNGTYDFSTGAFTPFGSAVTVNGTGGNDFIDHAHTPAGQPFVGSGNDTVFGNGGNDTIDGGAGSDSVLGGPGNDTYIYGAGDTISENPGGGTDTEKSSITVTLADNVEKLILTGSGGIDGTGNGLNNTMTGNSGVNTLTGLGGNDTYVIGTTDTVVEATGGGTDTIKIAGTHTLEDNVEKLTLTGSGIIDGTGNTLANTLTGNAQANLLSGLDGKDTLVGGAGDDTLHGGTGSDVLTGSAGHDGFVFDTALNAGNNVDTINDFDLVDDVIKLDHTIFASIGATLGAAEFHNGTAAADGNDFIIYDAGTGNLSYDDDGTGIHAKILFATLNNHAAITAADFTVI